MQRHPVWLFKPLCGFVVVQLVAMTEVRLRSHRYMERKDQLTFHVGKNSVYLLVRRSVVTDENLGELCQ